jgi:simple sugar transport system ATP-binding protein
LLSPIEGDRLLAHLKTYAEVGRIVILITHKLREVMSFANTVTVLRRGHAVETGAVRNMTIEALTSLMMGGEHVGNNHTSKLKITRPKPSPLLNLHNVASTDQRGKQLLSDIELSLAPGWICGVAGVAGNGQTDLANIASGLAVPAKGCVVLNGDKPIVRRYVPADRTELGTGAQLSITENLVLRAYQSETNSKHGVLDWEKLTAYASDLSTAYQIKMRAPSDRIATLSGGNIQRVVLARELAEKANVLVVHNPTSGLDMATARFARNKIQEASSRGSAILLISDDLDELLELSDEILVLHAGRIAGHYTRENATIEEIGAVMAGLAPNSPKTSVHEGGA